MFTAIHIENGTEIEPSTKARGLCKCCNSEVIAKCGEIKVHHWAHKSKRSCDSWYEPMTQWHKDWQGAFPAEWREKVMFDKVTGEKHIADIHTPDGITIEVQHSSISNKEFRSRCDFYKKLIWVIDGSNFGYKGMQPDSYSFVFRFDHINAAEWGQIREGIVEERINQMQLELLGKGIQLIYGIKDCKCSDIYMGHRIFCEDSGCGKFFISFDMSNSLVSKVDFVNKILPNFGFQLDSIYCKGFATCKFVKGKVKTYSKDTYKWRTNKIKDLFRKRAIHREFDRTPVFIDNIKGRPHELYWWNKQKFVSKYQFLRKYAEPKKQTT